MDRPPSDSKSISLSNHELFLSKLFKNDFIPIITLSFTAKNNAIFTYRIYFKIWINQRPILKFIVKVLIVGYGYVGTAVASIFKNKEKIIIDPKYFKTSIKDITAIKFDAVFVCVDTSTEDKFKTLRSVLSELNSNLKRGTVVCCKSTAPPHIYEEVSKKFKNIYIVHSPEYLSHHSNIKDFQKQEFAILGGNFKSCIKIKNIFRKKLKHIKTFGITDIKTAALVKYSENAFLSYKITFFNELYKIHKQLKLDSSFEETVRLLTLDKRIGTSHTQVPGRDGKKGWGGHCFTKDNQQFQQFTNSRLIEFMIKINKLHRST